MILPLCIKRGEIVVDPGLETLPREGLRDVHVFGELLQSGQTGVDCGGNRQRVGRFAERRLDGPLIAGERRIPGGHGGSKIAAPHAAIEDRQTEARAEPPMDTIVPILRKIIESSKVST